MAPWDEYGYFNLPLVSYPLISSTAVSQVVKGNPNRVGLIFSCPSNPGGVVSIDPSMDIGGKQGFLVQSSTLPLYLTQKDFGNLVQVPWFAVGINVNNNNLTVIEIVLIRWPSAAGS